VFYEGSPRNISVEAAREIAGKLPEGVEKVGVFVDLDAEQIRRVVHDARLSAVQLHGSRSIESVWKDRWDAPEFVGASKLIPMIHGDSLKEGGFLIGEAAIHNIFAILLDSNTDGPAGGTGTAFDWQGTCEMVQALTLTVPIIVAGGLTPINVSTAVKLLQPFGVDVASGVEARPGKKDPEKVRAFVRAVRETDRKSS
jgi:phosphoribosylanthranilate isomerase